MFLENRIIKKLSIFKKKKHHMHLVNIHKLFFKIYSNDYSFVLDEVTQYKFLCLYSLSLKRERYIIMLLK